MTDRSTIFSAPMIRALLDRRKTQTRRFQFDARGRLTTWGRLAEEWQRGEHHQRIWVRENFAFVGGGDPGILLYAADWRERCAVLGLENCDNPPRWTPSIHMPRRCSRLTLAVTGVKVERLNEISRSDAIAEGCDGTPGHDTVCDFSELWESLHGPGSWDANPWIVALTFTVHRRNIDAISP